MGISAKIHYRAVARVLVSRSMSPILLGGGVGFKKDFLDSDFISPGKAFVSFAPFSWRQDPFNFGPDVVEGFGRQVVEGVGVD